jgi:hypothetical protein
MKDYLIVLHQVIVSCQNWKSNMAATLVRSLTLKCMENMSKSYTQTVHN